METEASGGQSQNISTDPESEAAPIVSEPPAASPPAAADDTHDHDLRLVSRKSVAVLSSAPAAESLATELPPPARKSFLGGMLSRKRDSASAPVNEKPRTSLLSSMSSKIDPTASAGAPERLDEEWTAVEPPPPPTPPPSTSRKSTWEAPEAFGQPVEKPRAGSLLGGSTFSRKSVPVVKVFAAAGSVTVDPPPAGTAEEKAEEGSPRPSDPLADQPRLSLQTVALDNDKTVLVASSGASGVSSSDEGWRRTPSMVKPGHRNNGQRNLLLLGLASVVGLIILASLAASVVSGEHPGQQATLPGAAAGATGGPAAVGSGSELILVQAVTVEATLESFDQEAYIAHLISALPGVAASVISSWRA